MRRCWMSVSGGSTSATMGWQEHLLKFVEETDVSQNFICDLEQAFLFGMQQSFQFWASEMERELCFE